MEVILQIVELKERRLRVDLYMNGKCFKGFKKVTGISNAMKHASKMTADLYFAQHVTAVTIGINKP